MGIFLYIFITSFPEHPPLLCRESTSPRCPKTGPFTENARQAGALELYLIGRWLLKNSAKKAIMGRERGSCHASLPLSGRLPARHSNFAVFGHESRSTVTRLRQDLGAVHTDTQGRIIHPVAGTMYLLLIPAVLFINMEWSCFFALLHPSEDGRLETNLRAQWDSDKGPSSSPSTQIA